MQLAKTQQTIIFSLIFVLSIAFYFLGIYKFFFVAVGILGIFAAWKKLCPIKVLIISLLISCLAIFYVNYRKPIPDKLSTLVPAGAVIKGRIVSIPDIKDDKSVKFEVNVSKAKIKGQKFENLKSRTLVKAYNVKDTSKFQIGDNIDIYGFIRVPRAATNPGEFNYKRYLQSKRIFTIATISPKCNVKILPQNSKKWLFIQKMNNIKMNIIKTHSRFLNTPYLELLGGMVFGDNAISTPEILKQNFIKAGLSHVLAASGMNVTFIFAAWLLFARLVRVPMKPAIASGGVLVAFYCCMTGFPPSIARAALIIELVIVGKLFNKSADNIAILCFVCALLLLYDPYMIWNVGFQLSFLVTIGLFIGFGTLESISNFCTQFVPEEIDEKLSFKLFSKEYKNPISSSMEWLVAVIVVPIIAQFWAMPIQAYVFNTFSPYSVLSNIIVVPLVEIVSFIGFAGSIISLIPLIGTKICFLTDIILKPVIVFIYKAAEFFATRHLSIISCPKPSVLCVLIFYLALIAISFGFKYNFEKKKLNLTILILLTSLIIGMVLPYFDHSTMRISCLEAGKADATMIITPDKKAILVNAGNKGRLNKAQTSIVPYLKDVGIKNIDYVIFTDYKYLYPSAIKDILEEENIKNIYMPAYSNLKEKNSYKRMKAELKDNNIKNISFIDNKMISAGNSTTIKVHKSKNAEGLGIEVNYKKFSMNIANAGEAEKKFNIVKNVAKQTIANKKNSYNLQKTGGIVIETDGQSEKIHLFR